MGIAHSMASLNDLLAAGGTHPDAKTVRFLLLPIVGTERRLHDPSP